MFRKKSPFENKKGTLLRKESEDTISSIDNSKKLKQDSFKYRKQENMVPANQTIAFCSTHKGAGCTHISLALAFELSKKYSVALVERDPTAELKAFDTMYDLKKGNLNSKKLDNLDVYFYGANELIHIIKAKYDYIILDIGTLLSVDADGTLVKSEDITEVYRADTKILVTQTREWQLEHLAEFIKYDKDMNDWIILANLSTEKNYKDLKKVLKRTTSEVIKMPYIEDLFNFSINEIIKVIR